MAPAVQLFLALMLIPALAMTCFNMRWWHVVGAEELEALPALEATIPAPDNWEHSYLEQQPEIGFMTFMDPPPPPEGSGPEGYVIHAFDVPTSYTFADLEVWMASPEWKAPGSFGPITSAQCDQATTTCRAHLLPSDGGEREYFITADHSAGDVKVRLEYRALDD